VRSPDDWEGGEAKHVGSQATRATCSDSHHLANAAVSACAALSSTLDSVRARHAELDSREYHCVDGSVESNG
jgi:hypothetical protein